MQSNLEKIQDFVANLQSDRASSKADQPKLTKLSNIISEASAQLKLKVSSAQADLHPDQGSIYDECKELSESLELSQDSKDQGASRGSRRGFPPPPRK